MENLRYSRETVIPNGNCVSEDKELFAETDTYPHRLEIAKFAIAACQRCEALTSCRRQIGSRAMQLHRQGAEQSIIGGEIISLQSPRVEHAINIYGHPLPVDNPSEALDLIRQNLIGGDLGRQLQQKYKDMVPDLQAAFLEAYPDINPAALDVHWINGWHILINTIRSYALKDTLEYVKNTQWMLEMAYEYFSDVIALKSIGVGRPTAAAMRHSAAHYVTMISKYAGHPDVTESQIIRAINNEPDFPELVIANYLVRVAVFRQEYKDDPFIDDYTLRHVCISSPESCDIRLADIKNNMQTALAQYKDHPFITPAQVKALCINTVNPFAALQQLERRTYYVKEIFFPHESVSMSWLAQICHKNRSLDRNKLIAKLGREPVLLEPLSTDAATSLALIRHARQRGKIIVKSLLVKHLEPYAAWLTEEMNDMLPSAAIDTALAARLLLKAVSRYAKIQDTHAAEPVLDITDKIWLRNLASQYLPEILRLQEMGCISAPGVALYCSADHYQELIEAGVRGGLTAPAVRDILSTVTRNHETFLQEKMRRWYAFREKYGNNMPHRVLNDIALHSIKDGNYLDTMIATVKMLLVQYGGKKTVRPHQIWDYCAQDVTRAPALVEAHVAKVEQLIATYKSTTELIAWEIAQFASDHKTDPHQAILDSLGYRAEIRLHYAGNRDVNRQVVRRCASAAWKTRIDTYLELTATLRRQFAEQDLVDDETICYFALFTPKQATQKIHRWLHDYQELKSELAHNDYAEDWMLRRIARSGITSVRNISLLMKILEPTIKTISFDAARSSYDERDQHGKISQTIEPSPPDDELNEQLREVISIKMQTLTTLEKSVIAHVYGLEWLVDEADAYDETTLELLTGSSNLSKHIEEHIFPKLRAT